jgi:hypothetical protein
MVLREQFLSIVPPALSYLYREGRAGHWVDARTTAYVIDALLCAGESLQSRNIVYATSFLLANFREEQQGGSWGSEIWDTALVLRTMASIPVPQDKMRRDALEWIASKQLEDGSFDGEPWDTLYVSLALLRQGQLAASSATLDWLLSIQGSDGSFISNHYTGLFCQVMAGYLDSEVLDTQMEYQVRNAATLALGHLWNVYDHETLWGGSAWTNAFVIKGISALRNPKILPESQRILTWYQNRQDRSGAWDDPVRTAIVAESLWSLQLFVDLDLCRHKSLQTLTAEFFSRSTQDDLVQQVSLRTIKVPVNRAKRLIEKDESGNWVLTLTPDREKMIGIAAGAVSAMIGGAYWLVRNLDQIKHFLLRK